MNKANESNKNTACRQVSEGETFVGKQGLNYAVGISAETVGARGIHMQMVRIPPGGRAQPHRHEHHETAIYVISGISHCLHGDQLEHLSVVKQGDYFYIPANVPHLPYNPGSEICVAIIARTDANDQEGVVLMPELTATAELRMKAACEHSVG